jgi:hypothetical protein
VWGGAYVGKTTTTTTKKKKLSVLGWWEFEVAVQNKLD